MIRGYIQKSLIAIMSLFVLSSCQSPELYEDEIIDVVTYDIASADYLVVRINEMNKELKNPLLSDIYSAAAQIGYNPSQKIEKEILSFTAVADELFLDGMTRLQSLEEVAQDSETKNGEIAKAILTKYNSTSIALSDYTLVSEDSYQKTWSFKEIRSGIEFLFTIEFDSDQGLWLCEATDESVEYYITRKVDM